MRGGDDVRAVPALACRDELGEAEATPLAAAAAALGTATPLTSKLQRTPAWMHREQDGLRRSQRRLKWRQRSHVLTSRIWGMLFLDTRREQSRARRGCFSLLAGATRRWWMSRFRMSVPVPGWRNKEGAKRRRMCVSHRWQTGRACVALCLRCWIGGLLATCFVLVQCRESRAAADDIENTRLKPGYFKNMFSRAEQMLAPSLDSLGDTHRHNTHRHNTDATTGPACGQSNQARGEGGKAG